MVPFIMVLIGCPLATGQCDAITTLPVAYASQNSCLDARADIVAASAGLGYARVIAECRLQTAGAPSKINAKVTPTT